MKWVKLGSLVLLGVVYVLAGINHFVNPDFYRPMMPPALPAHDLLIWLSGLAEVALGVGVFIPQTRRWAAWGIIALLIAVVPANIHIAVNDIALDGGSEGAGAANWVRVAFQAVLILWAWWHTGPERGQDPSSSATTTSSPSSTTP
ncbi:MAG: DoxX family membrane protein [Deltaproteobacteria bacterium]|nr:DoxX family membrane protein [Deltaproteobacteria bacterium]MBW2413302.1 DoxX family membrane protein [Deltaproteobacteria bacterium]